METFRRNKTEAAETAEFLELQIDSEFKYSNGKYTLNMLYIKSVHCVNTQ